MNLAARRFSQETAKTIDAPKPCVYDLPLTARRYRATKRKMPKKITRRPWSKDDNRELRAQSKAKSPVAKIAQVMKAVCGSVTAARYEIGIGAGPPTVTWPAITIGLSDQRKRS